MGLHPLGAECPIHDGESGARVSAEADEAVYGLWNELLDASVAKAEAGEGAGGAEGASLGGALDEALAARRAGGAPLDAAGERLLSWHYANLEYGCSANLSDVSLAHWNQDEVYGGFGGAHAMVKGGYSQAPPLPPLYVYKYILIHNCVHLYAYISTHTYVRIYRCL